MKIAIFDGILETHVASSLERSMKRQGHVVLNTGKIGSGFEFPRRGADISHLEVAVQRTIEFEPDLVFVMRPASLPMPLLSKVRNTGAQLVAWYSDDPVLFDLSYGPVLEQYDLVLHCGGPKVLAFYEEYFGYATGVNFPFWTDHEAFPVVWGTRPAGTDLMFLGNVHDKVRRKRYFDLGKLERSIRIHGAIGADYFGLNGGYLFTDQEVALAGSTTKMALNIPQFFEDHRGLPTWFPGLGDLGFFEYPSRVVQYMAMGIPTISVIPGSPDFDTYPEMLVAETIEEAGNMAGELIESGQLEELSQRVVSRFDRHFSADARLMALMDLLVDDSWKRLDPVERSQWFTQFDATKIETSDLLIGPDAPNGATVGLTVPLTEDGNGLSEETLGQAGDDQPSGKAIRVAMLHGGCLNDNNRSSAVAEALLDDPHFDVVLRSIDSVPEILTSDPQGICEFAIITGKLKNAFGTDDFDVLLLCEVDAALTELGTQQLRSMGILSMIVADSVSMNDIRHLKRLLGGYRKVFCPNYEVVEYAKNRGFENIGFLPHFVRSEFLKALDAADFSDGVIQVRSSAATEEATAPAFSVEAKSVPKRVFDYGELDKLPLSELAETLKTGLALMSFAGTASSPEIHPLSPYVAVAAERVLVARNPVWQKIHPYENCATTIKDVGEIGAKIKFLSLDDSSLESEDIRKYLVSPGPLIEALLDAVSLKNEMPDRSVTLSNGAVFDVGIEVEKPMSNGKSTELKVVLHRHIGSRFDWWIRVRVDGRAAYGQLPESDNTFIVNGISDSNRIKVEMVYVGPSLDMSEGYAVSASVNAGSVSGILESSRVGSVYQLHR